MSPALNELFRLDGLHVCVIGGTGAIGAACVDMAEAMGASVSVVARTRDRILQRFPSARAAVALNLEAVESYSSTISELEELDGVIFAAGILSLKPWRSIPEAEFRRLNVINYEAPALLTRELLRQRKLRDGSSIVYISSIAGCIGAGGHVAYSGTKGALNAFCRSLAVEVASRTIRVNCVSPGVVRTPMASQIGISTGDDRLTQIERDYPLGLGTPDDVAGAVGFLLSPAAKWITATDLIVDGGISHT